MNIRTLKTKKNPPNTLNQKKVLETIQYDLKALITLIEEKMKASDINASDGLSIEENLDLDFTPNLLDKLPPDEK